MPWLDRTSLPRQITAVVVALTALTLATPPLAWSASPSGDETPEFRKGNLPVGLRGHGFVGSNGAFATIDVPGATAFTIAFGVNSRGDIVGGYVDRAGTLHGFVRRDGAITAIDVPGAAATLASKINAQGQIVGAYSENRNTPAFRLPHGFLLDKGAFTKIDFPGAVRTPTFRHQ